MLKPHTHSNACFFTTNLRHGYIYLVCLFFLRHVICSARFLHLIFPLLPNTSPLDYFVSDFRFDVSSHDGLHLGWFDGLLLLLSTHFRCLEITPRTQRRR